MRGDTPARGLPARRAWRVSSEGHEHPELGHPDRLRGRAGGRPARGVARVGGRAGHAAPPAQHRPGGVELRAARLPSLGSDRLAPAGHGPVADGDPDRVSFHAQVPGTRAPAALGVVGGLPLLRADRGDRRRGPAVARRSSRWRCRGRGAGAGWPACSPSPPSPSRCWSSTCAAPPASRSETGPGCCWRRSTVISPLASSEVWADLGFDVPRLGSVGILSFNAILMLAALRFRLFDKALSPSAALSATIVASVGGIAYLSIFRAAGTNTALLVFGTLTVTLVLLAAARLIVGTVISRRVQLVRLATLGRMSAQMGARSQESARGAERGRPVPARGAGPGPFDRRPDGVPRPHGPADRPPHERGRQVPAPGPGGAGAHARRGQRAGERTWWRCRSSPTRTTSR